MCACTKPVRGAGCRGRDLSALLAKHVMPCKRMHGAPRGETPGEAQQAAYTAAWSPNESEVVTRAPCGVVVAPHASCPHHDSHEVSVHSWNTPSHVMHPPFHWLQQHPHLPSPPQTTCALPWGSACIRWSAGAVPSHRRRRAPVYIKRGSDHMTTALPALMRNAGPALHV